MDNWAQRKTEYIWKQNESHFIFHGNFSCKSEVVKSDM